MTEERERWREGKETDYFYLPISGLSAEVIACRGDIMFTESPSVWLTLKSAYAFRKTCGTVLRYI